ncbi:hypothetical protein AMELA_G00162710, partial [Ameiurus melas]
MTKEEHIEIVLTAGSGSGRKVAMELNRKHGEHITHTHTAAKLNKFDKTGSVEDQPRSGRPPTSTDEDTTDVVLANCTYCSPLCMETFGTPCIYVNTDLRSRQE